VNVTLSPLSSDPADSGSYRIRRGQDRYEAPGPIVLNGYGGWDVIAAGRTHRTFRRMAEARTWLNSDEGQAWLDQLPKAAQ
jgi:hypothetical protein